METNNTLGTYFKSRLGHLEARPDAAEWDQLNSKLSKYNFFRFSFSTFNIYYALLALSGSIGLLWAITHTGNPAAAPKTINTELCTPAIVVPVDSIKNKQVPENTLPLPAKQTKKKKNCPEMHESTIVEITPTADTAITASAFVAPSDSTLIPRERPVKVVKRSITIKPQPVIIKDTLRLNSN